MEEFITLKINNNIAQYLVFGVTTESPLFLLNEIIDKTQFFDGDKVLFDQLLQTGNTKNRFLILTYLNNEFSFSTAKNIDANIVDNETRLNISEFLRQNQQILKYSILVSSEKEQILSGGTI